jgi:hypothetical protein
VAGSPLDDFVQFSIEHLANHVNKDPERLISFHRPIDDALIPFLKERRVEWGYILVNGIREEWQINGFAPPPFLSDAERLWAKEGSAVPY